MQTNLQDLTERTLQEINKFGLCPEAIRQYRRTYERLKDFATKRNVDSNSTQLLSCFLAEIEKRYKSGAIGHSRRNHLRRASLLLRDYAENERLEWKVYGEISRPMPTSQEFLCLYSQYIDNLKSDGRSKNTIESSKNMVRQFLLFLDDNGHSALAETPLEMVPSFFQHLLATYQPTSIRTVASNIRSFLEFADGGERFLSAVPSRCVRNRPIIPVLSEKEYASLKGVLQGPDVALRDKAIIQLALRTGLRSVDIVGMKLSDIDWVNDTIAVAQSKTGRPFKIPLCADVGNYLSSYILTERPRTDTPYVFLRSQAPHRVLSDHSACYAIVRKVFARAGIRLGDERKGLHVIRHSVASRMLSHGVPVTTISSVLGHANKASTDVYLATDEPRMRECGLPLHEIPMNCGGLR
jgi:site-specific recombinase XerD